MLSSLVRPLSKLSVWLRMSFWHFLHCLHLPPTVRPVTRISSGLHTSSVLMETGKARGGGRAPGADRRMTREAVVISEREKYLSMSREEKRRVYRCRNAYATLDMVPTWSKLLKSDKLQRLRKASESSRYRANNSLNDIVTIWMGDITKLEIDAIANAANHTLLGGGGVDGAIHLAAGSALREECALLNGCDTGDAEITGGYKLPAKYVIHTVGPVGEKEAKLRSCYQNCLRLLKEYKLRSLALPCISTGVYGYPNEAAAKIALETTRDWLDTDKNSDLVDRIVFCLFLPKDVAIYEKLMYDFFPPGADGEDSDPEGQDEDDQAEADQGAAIAAATAAATDTATAAATDTATTAATDTTTDAAIDTATDSTTEPEEDQTPKEEHIEEDTGRTGADGDQAEDDQIAKEEEPEDNQGSGNKDGGGGESMPKEIDDTVETAEKER